jgi:HD superfamily phosphohydrolase
LAQQFIDNRYFQRLGELKQLATCDFIFPGAKHTRFEHSLGTYYLADRILNRIIYASDQNKLHEWLSGNPFLQKHYYDVTNPRGLNLWIAELVKIAALCHDIGHGAFSHIFDDIFVRNSIYKNHYLASHEARSCEIINLIVKESEILTNVITQDDIHFIQSIINPSQEHIGFIYQIVSNNLNGLDVDKYDYISRDAFHIGIKSGFDSQRLTDAVLVIDNNIVYPEQSEHTIYNMFMTRYSLHRQVYGHKGVVSAQHIVINIMEILDKVIGISESVTNMEKFVEMTDIYIIQSMKNILKFENAGINPYAHIMSAEDYANLKSLNARISTHNLYKHIGTFLTKDPIDNNIYEHFDRDRYIIASSKIGFVSGNKKNPLDNIYVYKTKDYFSVGGEIKAQMINKHDITFIVPEVYQEYVTMVFYKYDNKEEIAYGKQLCRKLIDCDAKV